MVVVRAMAIAGVTGSVRVGVRVMVRDRVSKVIGSG